MAFDKSPQGLHSFALQKNLNVCPSCRLFWIFSSYLLNQKETHRDEKMNK